MEDEQVRINVFRIYVLLFLFSAILAITFSLLAMSSVERVSSIDMGALDVSRETMLDIFDRYSKSGVSISGSVYGSELVLVKSGCNCPLNYTIYDLSKNTSSTYVFNGNVSDTELKTLYSLVFFDYNSTSPCLINVSLRIKWRDYVYRYLAVPGFIFFAVSITLMYKILITRTVEKYYEGKK